MPGPFLPPRPASPPTLQFQIPPGTCGLACSVFDTLAVNPTFSSLVTAVRAAGLVERLSGPDPVTIFAPTNAAFDLLPPLKLQVTEDLNSLNLPLPSSSRSYLQAPPRWRRPCSVT